MASLRLSILPRIFLNRCIREYAASASSKIYLGKLKERRWYATAIELKVDSQNVVSSGLPDVSGFENIYLHDLIWENIERWPNHTAIICSETGKSYTYSQLRKACGRLATSLRKSKLLPGDTVAIILPNIPEFVITLLAANEAGLRTTLINPAYTMYEIKKQVEDSDVQAIFTLPAKYADVNASIENNSKIKLPIVIVNDSGSGSGSIAKTIKFDDLIRDDIEEFSVSQKTDVDYEDTVLVPYSSGTTGLPKGIETTHRNIVANMLQSTCPAIFPGVEATEHYQEVIPLILPIFHVYGLNVVTYSYLRIGAKLVCMPQFSMNKFIKLLEDHRCTLLHAVPPIIQMMANDKRTSRHVASIRLILSGAASVGEETIAQFQSCVSNRIIFTQGYGASELSPIATISRDAPPASSGYLVPNTQMRIVGTREDNLGRNLILGETGEIYIRGPQVMKGYYKNPQATADTIDGDWYKTGDLGYYTEHGLYVQARLKDMIKVKGFQVAPIELEEVIRGHGKIQDVAVIGVAHDKYGEIPKAFVVPKSGVRINENEIKEYVAERLTKFKHLGYVQVVESIPKTASGKILRRELAKL